MRSRPEMHILPPANLLMAWSGAQADDQEGPKLWRYAKRRKEVALDNKMQEDELRYQVSI